MIDYSSVAMHGYGLYVWSAYGCAFSIILFNFFKAIKREKYIKKQLKNRINSL
ncbi:MAG: heme exporter protein CcmD [Legionellales bacterium RIFCSPHIGHO2_12_FULL_35_11]|nr:MAG: heme exporter protein CcmD [Legionellales bacterium RIFCSPHIGHO2_12_FULL_35_11]